MKQCHSDKCFDELCEKCHQILSKEWKLLIKEVKEVGLQNEICEKISTHRKLMEETGFEPEDIRVLTSEA